MNLCLPPNDIWQSQGATIMIKPKATATATATAKPRYVHEYMALPAVDLFAGIVSANTAAFSSLNRLAVNDRSGRLNFASIHLASADNENTVEALPDSKAPHCTKELKHARPWRKIVRQHSPLAATTAHVENGVEQLTTRIPTRTTSPGFGRKQRRNEIPFAITNIRLVSFSQHSISSVPHLDLGNSTELILSFLLNKFTS